MVSGTAAFVLPLVWKQEIPQYLTKSSYVSMEAKCKAACYGLHLLVIQGFIRARKSSGSTFLIHLEHRIEDLNPMEIVFLGKGCTQRIIVDTYDGSRRADRRDRWDRRTNWWIVASVKCLLDEIILVVQGGKPFLQKNVSTCFVGRGLFQKSSFNCFGYRDLYREPEKLG